jgi:hypothetical protein
VVAVNVGDGGPEEITDPEALLPVRLRTAEPERRRDM